MENETLVWVFGLVVFLCLMAVELIAFQRQKSSIDLLATKVNQAEEDLRADVLQFGKAELIKTKSGRELLKLMVESSKSVSSSQHDATPSTQVQHNNLTIAAKWMFVGFSAVVLIEFLLGANIKDATWLNSDIAAAEANRINIENTYQQATYELQQQLAQAQTEAEIREIQRQQALLEAQYQHDIMMLEQDLARRETAFRTWMTALTIIAWAFALALILSTTIWAGSKAIVVVRSIPKANIKEARYIERLERQEKLIKEYQEKIRMLSSDDSS